MYILHQGAVDPAELGNVALHTLAEDLQVTQATSAGEEDSPDEEEEEQVNDCFVHLVLSFALHHGLSKSGVDDLLDLLHTVGSKDTPQSKYMLLKDILAGILFGV